MGKFDDILLLTDLDGTFFMPDSIDISEENLTAVNYFIKNGGHFSVATGRQPFFIKEVIGTKIINAPVISANGTLVYDLKEDRILYKETLPENAVNVVEYVKTNYPDMHAEANRVELSEPYDYTNPDFSKKDVLKVLFWHDSSAEMILKLKHELTELFPQYYFVRCAANGLELLPGNCSKGACLDKIRSILPIKKIIAAGDYENDITLIQNADIGYAAENGVDELKKLADRVGRSCGENLIAQIIYDLDSKGG